MQHITTYWSLLVRGDFACGQRLIYDKFSIGSFATGMRQR